MSLSVHGIGAVTALGPDLSTTWDALRSGAEAPTRPLENPLSKKRHLVRSVPEDVLASFRPPARLRRSSLISHMAVAAARQALADAGGSHEPESTALVFATTNGGVIYTRRFFADIAGSGTQAGSPLLFPETVYNAPCSHIAADLSIAGVATALVNDATVAIDALGTAADLLESGACRRCLVVAAEEADWITCEGYSTWNPGMIFAEGAAALVLGLEGGITVKCPPPCRVFESLESGRSAMEEVLAGSGSIDFLASPASGGRLDDILPKISSSETLSPRLLLGEGFSFTALLQVACGALALRHGARTALAPIVGLNGQLGTVRLSR